MLILAIVNGFLGYSLPDDLVSGTGIRIAYSIVLSIPLVGSYLAFFVFGGNFPGTASSRGSSSCTCSSSRRSSSGSSGRTSSCLCARSTRSSRARDRTEKNVVGSPMFPVFMAKTTGFLFIVGGVIALLGAFAQINPIWQFGPYTASRISYAVQPDWYMGWLDGALRIFPSWEFTGFGHTIPFEVLIPAVIFPGIVFNLAYAWPLIERKFTGDNALHHLLDRPRNRPKRTAAGARCSRFMGMFFIASSTDVLANFFHVSLNTVLLVMRILVIAVPIVAYPLTYKICKELQGVHGGGKRKTPTSSSAPPRANTWPCRAPPTWTTSDHELEPDAGADLHRARARRGSRERREHRRAISA